MIKGLLLSLVFVFSFLGCASKKTDGPGKAAAESVSVVKAESCAMVLAVSGMT